jgi:hypothetical protein
MTWIKVEDFIERSNDLAFPVQIVAGNSKGQVIPTPRDLDIFVTKTWVTDLVIQDNDGNVWMIPDRKITPHDFTYEEEK